MNKPITPYELARIRRRIEQIAIKRSGGPYRLTSGGYSDYYCDLKSIMLHPGFASYIGKLFVPFIERYKVEAVGGLATGSIPVSDAIGYAYWEKVRVLPTFFVRKEAKNSGPTNISRISAAVGFFDEGKETAQGRRVAIVEDTMTTGESTREAIEAIKVLGCEVVLIACVIERDGHPGRKFESENISFQRLFYTNARGDLFIDNEVKRLVNL